MATRHPLAALNVSKIDIDAARHHFDLPIEDQFHSKADLRAGLKATKGQLLDMLGGDARITVFRGMTVPADFIATLVPGVSLGECWAWDQDGALKGSGLSSGMAPQGEIGVLLIATVEPTGINWPFTVAVNTFHEDEKEIVVEEGASLVLHQVLLVEHGRAVRDILTQANKGLAVTSS